jgi:hypothetical protein
MYGIKELTLAIDFDGVIHDDKHPVEGRRMGPPIAGAKEALERYKSIGHKIIVHSVWGDENGAKHIADWLAYYKIPFHLITNTKPTADFYIDDRAIKFVNWEQLNLK